MKPKTKINRFKPYLIILAVVIFLEIALFNFRFFEGIGYKPTQLTDFKYGSGVEFKGNNEISINSSGEKWIEFDNIDEKINNIFIDIRDKRNTKNAMRNGINWDFQRVQVNLSVTDEANAQYMNMPERYVVYNVERTKYIKLHTAGKSTKVKLTFNSSDNQTLALNAITLNKQVPFSVKPLRVLVLFLALALLYMLRCGSPVYNIQRRSGSKRQLLALALIVVLNICLSAAVLFSNPKFINTEIDHHKQYAELADSFLEGKPYLISEEPPQALIDMENPYDKNERDRVMSENGTGIKWDHAYYNGKYYVYFGALPVLVYYLPYKVITGTDFSTHMGVFINLVIYMIFVYLLLNAAVKKRFKNIPFVSFVLIAQVLTFSSGIIFAVRKADLYAMPITMGLTLSTMGLYFWISSLTSSKKAWRCIRLLAGSLCMALVAGCRPQLLLASFLAVPLFWNKVFKERELFSKKAWQETLVFVLPYVIVAAVVMWYNYIRFDSVFDFGANYNLTTNDMTKRGISLGRVPLGIFCYFLQLPVTYARFPFITGCNLANNYMGTTISEMMLGGIFATKPFLWLILLIKYAKTSLKNKGVYAFVICSALFSIIIAMADTQMAGILYRYYMDYTFLMLIAAAFVVFAFLENHSGKRFLFVLSLLCVVCLFYDAATVFVQGDLSTDYTNPDFYYSIESALAFYM